jgi:hypothetical protein
MQEVHRKSMNFFMELVYRQVDCFKNQLVGTLVRKKYKICKNIPGFFYILPKDSRFL